MAWYSHTFAIALAEQQIQPGQAVPELLQANESAHSVYTYSRNGVLLWTLEKIWTAAGFSDELYLLKDEALLMGADLQRQLTWLQAFLSKIKQDPQAVLEATKERYAPTGTLHTPGFEPLEFERVYPPQSHIQGEWVYFYTHEEVHNLLEKAACGSNPRPETDDEGESLEYVFGVVKSHLALLETALKLGGCVAYAEMNPVS